MEVGNYASIVIAVDDDLDGHQNRDPMNRMGGRRVRSIVCGCLNLYLFGYKRKPVIHLLTSFIARHTHVIHTRSLESLAAIQIRLLDNQRSNLVIAHYPSFPARVFPDSKGQTDISRYPLRGCLRGEKGDSL